MTAEEAATRFLSVSTKTESMSDDDDDGYEPSSELANELAALLQAEANPHMTVSVKQEPVDERVFVKQEPQDTSFSKSEPLRSFIGAWELLKMVLQTCPNNHQ